MRFSKRQVKSILIKRQSEIVYHAAEDKDCILTVFAHEDDESGSQLLGIERVNKVTGEVCTQRINLPTTDMYLVSVVEILAIES